MKSRTSFFNATVLRKDITRFAPAWGLYLTAMLLVLLTVLTDEGYRLAVDMGLTINLLSIVNLGYALVCGALLFGDLFNSRLCNAMHAMPMRREGWFLTHLTSGLLFSVVPNLVVALCLMPRLGLYWYVSLIWLGGMTAVYLFFFGAAVLSAMCTGSRFAMVLVYGLINFLAILAMWMLQFLYEPLLFGIEIDQSPFVFFSPVTYLCTNELNYVNFLDKITGFYNPNDGWPYTLGIACVGGMMLIGALLIYRNRQLESAGDFITLRALSPVFLVLYTMAAGMVLFIFSYLFATDYGYLFLAVGIVVGFITGRMLLSRTVRIFKPATFIGLAVMMAVLFGSLGLARLDVLGIVRWVPEREAVQSVSIRYAYDDFAYIARDVEEIEELTKLHSQIVEDRVETESWDTYIYLTYTLRDESTVTRRYGLDYSKEAAKEVTRWLCKPEYLLQEDDLSQLAQTVNYITVDTFSQEVLQNDEYVFEEDEVQELLEAVIADCRSGALGQDYNYRNMYQHADQWGYLTLQKAGDRDVHLYIWNDAVNIIQWIYEHADEAVKSYVAVMDKAP